MDFTAAGLCVALVLGGLGTGLFIYGKKQRRAPQLVAGIALMGFPSLVTDPIPMAAIGACIVGLMVLALRRGM